MSNFQNKSTDDLLKIAENLQNYSMYIKKIYSEIDEFPPAGGLSHIERTIDKIKDYVEMRELEKDYQALTEKRDVISEIIHTLNRSPFQDEDFDKISEIALSSLNKVSSLLKKIDNKK